MSLNYKTINTIKYYNYMAKDIFIKIFVAISYLAMIIINFLANALPINNITTGEISDMYPNLFTPAGFTFSIWGLIYILLGAYVLYQLGLFGKEKRRDKIINKIGVYFIISSIANIAWIFSWHYQIVWLSLVFMLVILFSLIKIATTLGLKKLNKKEYFFLVLPFSIYFGWITVATIANVTVFLISLNWDGFGIAPQTWTIAILLIGALIGILRTFKDKSVAYLAVFIWAYFGILVKHVSEEGFAYQYPSIIGALLVCILFFIIIIVTLKKSSKHF
jgi:hypothetical protein